MGKPAAKKNARKGLAAVSDEQTVEEPTMKMAVFHNASPETQPALIVALANVGSEKKNQGAVLKLMGIRKRVENVWRTFLEARSALVSEYGEGEGDKKSIKPTSPRYEEFMVDFRELCAQPVPAEMLKEKIKLSELWRRGPSGEREPIDIAENDVEALGPLLVIDIDEDE